MRAGELGATGASGFAWVFHSDRSQTLHATTITYDVSRTQVRTELRSDAPGIVIAILLIALGVASGWIYFLRRKPRRDPAVLWFGILALLYVFRLRFCP